MAAVPPKENVMILKHLYACAVAVLVFGGGIAPQVWAEEPIGARAAAAAQAFVEEDLGTTTTGTDVWKLACPSNTAKVEADVNDRGGVDGVSLTVLLLRASTGKTSLKRSPDGGTSVFANLTGGPGTYYVIIHKTQSTSTSIPYDSIQRCLNSSGSDLPVTPQKVQDF
jgi:hypothetical protein